MISVKKLSSALGLMCCGALMLGTGCAGSEVETPDVADQGAASTQDMGTTPPRDMRTTTPVPDMTPTPRPCNGCKSSSGACLNGTTSSACGSGGSACTACQNGQLCDESQCVAPPECNADNCPGCCQDNVCVMTSTNSSCGSGGNACNNCTENNGICNADKQCELPCGPQNCAGCCTPSGQCIGGDLEASCGKSGEACQICAGDLDCETVDSGDPSVPAGQCVDTSCSATCEGCCDGSRCRTGDVGEECGSAGAQCQDCGDGAFCNATMMCEPKSDMRWDLVLLQGTFPEFQADGDDWDGFIGKLPDPFVRAKYTDLSSGDEAESESAAQDDTLMPVWNEVLFEGLSAEDIRSGLNFDYVDDDVTFNDTLAEDCTFPDVGILFDELPHILVCGRETDPATGMTSYEGGSFSVKLNRVTQ
jgi:hypothetical protein